MRQQRRTSRTRRLSNGATAILLVLAGILTTSAGAGTPAKLEPDGAPDRQSDGPGVPAPIVWPAPALEKGPFLLESAEERHIKVVVVSRALQQPWSMAFLPDGDILVTERPGRLRLVHGGVL